MRVQLEHLLLTAQPNGTWAGEAVVSIDGEQWSGHLIIGQQPQDTIRAAVEHMRGEARRLKNNTQRRAERRARREAGLCMSCPEQSKGWRCIKCASRLSILRNQRKERQIA